MGIKDCERTAANSAETGAAPSFRVCRRLVQHVHRFLPTVRLLLVLLRRLTLLGLVRLLLNRRLFQEWLLLVIRRVRLLRKMAGHVLRTRGLSQASINLVLPRVA